MNNPPAFPQFGCSEHNDSGMTLRDYFAAAAMQGMARRYGEPVQVAELIAKNSYVLADAMLKAREQ